MFEELGVFFSHEVGSLKTWSEVNKLKQDTFYQENTQRRKESREKLHKWVIETCKNKNESEKLQLGFFIGCLLNISNPKTIKNEPKPSSRWRAVSFFLSTECSVAVAGQWGTKGQ